MEHETEIVNRFKLGTLALEVEESNGIVTNVYFFKEGRIVQSWDSLPEFYNDMEFLNQAIIDIKTL